MRPAPSTPTSSAWTRTPVPRPPRARRRSRRLRRWLQRAAVIGLALLTAITVLHSILNSTAVRSRLRDRVEAALDAAEPRGELEVSGRIDGLFLEGNRLASEPVGPWRLSGAGTCLLYTSDAADERSSVDLGGR